MKELIKYRTELKDTLSNHIIPFWINNGVDTDYGGYLTSFDEHGVFDGNGIKNLVTQSRMVWGLSYLYSFANDQDKPKMKEAASQGATFLMDKFWDKKYGGFYWLLERDGSVSDSAKLTYGEAFAIYALAQYHLTFGCEQALDYAKKCFTLLQTYAADTFNGGYYENVEQDWTVSPAGAYGGDRKSLDTHMHLLEAFTTLTIASGKEIHKRKLNECWLLIRTHMINIEKGYGRNQFDLAFNPIPAIDIKRTWNAERATNELIENPVDTTSYGHNVELSWLADLALSVLGNRLEDDDAILLSLLNHALEFGYDTEYGGMYRDGLTTGEVIVKDKEWWQCWESMVGFLNGYVISGNESYKETSLKLWHFNKTFFMNYQVGESRQLLDRSGKPIVSNIGNPWKAIYHTGRAVAECIIRLDTLLANRG